MKIKYDHSVTEQEIGNDPCLGKDNIFKRSYDGRVVKTYLHDGSQVTGYLENCEGES